MKMIQPASLALLFASLVVLTPVAANAQSSDYRQGYQQGYRDGLAAGGRDGAPMMIMDARYGTRRGGFCDARGAIQRAVGPRTSARIRVDNRLCGDPALGIPKHIEVRYRCGDRMQRVDGPENSDIILRCD